jgi:hypothetical protein
MRLAISALPLLLCILVGCNPPTQSGYSPSVVEQPQPVHFFYGTLVGIRPATLEYGNEAGIGVGIGLSPWLAGLHVGGYGPAGGLRLSAAFLDIPIVASAPNLPATEYTVLLDRGTNPPDPYTADPRAAAVIVVQNDNPGEPPLNWYAHVIVRVVGNSARVMANWLPPAIENRLAAGPLPVPLQGQRYAYPSGTITVRSDAHAIAADYYPPAGMHVLY